MGAGGAAGSNGGGMDASGTEFSVMNIDEFLNENNLDFDHFPIRASEDEREQGMEASTNYRKSKTVGRPDPQKFASRLLPRRGKGEAISTLITYYICSRERSTDSDRILAR